MAEKISKALMKQVKREIIENLAGETDEEIIGLYEYWIAEGNSFSR